MPDDALHDLDANRRRNLIGLGVHAACYLVFNAWMTVMNLTTSPEHLWFFWLILGWGFGLTMHAVGILHFETLPEDERQRLLPPHQKGPPLQREQPPWQTTKRPPPPP